MGNWGPDRRTVLAGIAAGLAAPGVLRAQPVQVRVATALRLANYMPAYIAAREGLFARHGLNVSITAAASIAEPIAILNAGRADVAMTGTGMAVNSAIEGARTRVFAKMAGGIGIWVISKPGAEIRSLEELRGKRIASLRFPSNTVTSASYAMRRFGGFVPADAGVRFVEGPPGSIIPAVVDGRADVGCVFEWDASIAQTAHNLSVSLSFAEIIGPLAFTSAMARGEWLQQNPEAAQNFCNALAEALRMIRADPGLYARVAAAEFNQVPPAAIEAGSRRLLGTAGVVPTSLEVTQAEYEAILQHELAVGSVRGSASYADIVETGFAQRAAR